MNDRLMKGHDPVHRLTCVTSLLVLTLIATGCHAIRISEPPRTATEQLLLSTAVDRALEDVNLSFLKGKRTFFDTTYFESYDQEYVLGALREMLARNGALLTANAATSEVTVEVRCGGLGIDSRDSLFGLPDLNLPIPFAGQVESPEVTLYKSEHADSIAKLALLAFETDSGKLIDRSGPMVGEAKFHHYKILGAINWRVTTIPEKAPDR